jgi:hypothetical protein
MEEAVVYADERIPVPLMVVWVVATTARLAQRGAGLFKVASMGPAAVQRAVVTIVVRPMIGAVVRAAAHAVRMAAARDEDDESRHSQETAPLEWEDVTLDPPMDTTLNGRPIATS